MRKLDACAGSLSSYRPEDTFFLRPFQEEKVTRAILEGEAEVLLRDAVIPPEEGHGEVGEGTDRRAWCLLWLDTRHVQVIKVTRFSHITEVGIDEGVRGCQELGKGVWRRLVTRSSHNTSRHHSLADIPRQKE